MAAQVTAPAALASTCDAPTKTRTVGRAASPRAHWCTGHTIGGTGATRVSVPRGAKAAKWAARLGQEATGGRNFVFWLCGDATASECEGLGGVNVDDEGDCQADIEVEMPEGDFDFLEWLAA
jgi:hypothetical protein